MTLKARLTERFESISSKIASFFHKLYIKLFHTLENFYLSSFIFKYCFTNPWFQLPQNVLRNGEMTRVISTGLNGVSLVHHIF